MEKRIKLTIDVTLSSLDNYSHEYGFFDDSVHLIEVYFAKVPLEWLENGKLRGDCLSIFYSFLSNRGSLVGDSLMGDYILKAEVELLSDERKDEWAGQSKYYLANLDNSISEISQEQF